MSTYAADDYEAIRRRQEEIKAERNLILTGSSAPVHAQHDAATGETVWYTMTPGGDYDPA